MFRFSYSEVHFAFLISFNFECCVAKFEFTGIYIAWLFDFSCFMTSSVFLQNISRIKFLVAKYSTGSSGSKMWGVWTGSSWLRIGTGGGHL